MDKLRAVCITSNKGKYGSFVLTMNGPVQWRYMDFEASKMTGKSTVSFTINSNVLQENYRNCIIGLFEGNPPKFASEMACNAENISMSWHQNDLWGLFNIKHHFTRMKDQTIYSYNGNSSTGKGFPYSKMGTTLIYPRKIIIVMQTGEADNCYNWNLG